MLITRTPFLKAALQLDAVVSGAAGLLFVAGGSTLSPWLGLPTVLMVYAGLVLVPFVAFVVVLSRQERIRRLLLVDLIAINAIWVAASVWLVVAGPVEPTVLGVAFVLMQAAAVALFAALQAAALGRAPAVATA
jgi:hypothetical protein